MENKTKQELAELVAAQTKVIDRLTLELAARQPLADSFVAKPVAGELPPLPEPAFKKSRSYGFMKVDAWDEAMVRAYGDKRAAHAFSVTAEFIELPFLQPVQQPAAVGEASKPTHQQAMAGYEVACRYGVLENRAFSLTDDMFAAFAVPAAGVQGEHPPRVTVEMVQAQLDAAHQIIASMQKREDRRNRLGLDQPDSGRDAAMFWYIAMPDGSHDGGTPYLSEEDAQDYVDKRAIPGCSVRPLFAAHPANSAQVGLSDAAIDDIAKPYAGLGGVADYRAFARAILAATKKGG